MPPLNADPVVAALTRCVFYFRLDGTLAESDDDSIAYCESGVFVEG